MTTKRRRARLARAARLFHVLGHDVRIDLVELMGLTPDVNWTTKDLAEHVVMNQTNLYHHVHLLEESGLIVVAATRRVNGIIEKQYCASPQLAKGYAALLDAIRRVDVNV